MDRPSPVPVNEAVAAAEEKPHHYAFLHSVSSSADAHSVELVDGAAELGHDGSEPLEPLHSRRSVADCSQVDWKEHRVAQNPA
jgi:hypothetical protein